MATKKKIKVKAKAVAVKAAKKNTVVLAHHSKHHVTLRSVVALLSVLLSFSVLMLFYTYKDNIMDSGSFNLFLGLSAFLLVMMLVLQYLVNPKK